MAFLGTNDLRHSLPSIIVEEYDPNNIDNVCYNLRLGNEAYVTDSANKKKEILDEKNSQVIIEPGQFALLITKETIQLPNSLLGFISLRFSQKRKGLINVSGFHVDPGFHGKIVFSVYNAGPATIHLDCGKQYFSLWLSQLVQNSEEYTGRFQDQKTISADYIDGLNGTLASPNVLLKKTEELNEKISQVEQIVKEKQTNLDWKRNFILAILIAVALKLFWDLDRYKSGFAAGKDYKIEYDRLIEVINSKKTDSLIHQRIIQLIDSNVKRQTGKTELR